MVELVGTRPAATAAPSRFVESIESRASWVAACAALVLLSISYGSPLVLIVGIPTVLHGLYDTLLKKELNAGALAVALASFGWLAWQNFRLQGVEEEDARQHQGDSREQSEEITLEAPLGSHLSARTRSAPSG